MVSNALARYLAPGHFVRESKASRVRSESRLGLSVEQLEGAAIANPARQLEIRRAQDGDFRQGQDRAAFFQMPAVAGAVRFHQADVDVWLVVSDDAAETDDLHRPLQIDEPILRRHGVGHDPVDAAARQAPQPGHQHAGMDIGLADHLTQALEQQIAVAQRDDDHALFAALKPFHE